MQHKYLTPDLKQKLRQSVPHTVVVVVVCLFMMIMTWNFSYHMNQIHDEVRLSQVKSHEANERIDAMGQRIDQAYQYLLSRSTDKQVR